MGLHPTTQLVEHGFDLHKAVAVDGGAHLSNRGSSAGFGAVLHPLQGRGQATAGNHQRILQVTI